MGQHTVFRRASPIAGSNRFRSGLVLVRWTIPNVRQCASHHVSNKRQHWLAHDDQTSRILVSRDRRVFPRAEQRLAREAYASSRLISSSAILSPMRMEWTIRSFSFRRSSIMTMTESVALLRRSRMSRCIVSNFSMMRWYSLALIFHSAKVDGTGGTPLLNSRFGSKSRLKT
jgi:hypothetical protein